MARTAEDVDRQPAFTLRRRLTGVFLAWWCRPAVDPPPALAFTLAAPVLAAVLPRSSRRFPTRLDDNLSVAATAGAALWLASLASLAQLRRR
jgi:hypothetical protein